MDFILKKKKWISEMILIVEKMKMDLKKMKMKSKNGFEDDGGPVILYFSKNNGRASPWSEGVYVSYFSKNDGIYSQNELFRCIFTQNEMNFSKNDLKWLAEMRKYNFKLKMISILTLTFSKSKCGENRNHGKFKIYFLIVEL